MKTVLHIIESLSLGGATRAMMAAAKYSSRSGEFRHRVAPIKNTGVAPEVVTLAAQNSIEICLPASTQELHTLMEDADIVLLEWWNTPHMMRLLRSPLPACRLAAWFHVGGHEDPQHIPEEMIHFLDFAIACSPHTYEAPAFQQLLPEVRQAKTALAYGATDFERLRSFSPRAHGGFNVGYIGTVNFVKMHPHYVGMSARVQIPDVRFIVCGHGGEHHILYKQAHELGVTHRFSINEAVNDITPVLEILDVYGYPLCEDTYAASELTIQEAMFCGIPVVVFPYGGLKRLVVNDFTGYIVTNEVEYVQALEYLYHHPEERKRIALNAGQYARQIFGAEIASRKLNQVFEQLLSQPKRMRTPFGSHLDITTPAAAAGVEAFLDSLGPSRATFEVSMDFGHSAEITAADLSIVTSSHLMGRLGVRPYRNEYPSDPYLCFWAGLISMGEGHYVEALEEFTESLKLGFGGPRPWWYLAEAAHRAGSATIHTQVIEHIQQRFPWSLPGQFPQLRAG